MGNFNDEYQKLRKKRLNEENGGVERSSVPYQSLTKNSANIFPTRTGESKSVDIAPTASGNNNIT